MSDIIRELEENESLVLFVPNKSYKEDLLSVVKKISEKYDKILILSINNTRVALERVFIQKGIDVEKFYYIDCSTSLAGTQPKNEKRCMFVSSPSALTELSRATSDAIKDYEPQILIFDSPSTLLVYNNDVNTVIKFVHILISKLSLTNGKSIFISLEDDADQTLAKELTMFANKVIKMPSKHL